MHTTIEVGKKLEGQGLPAAEISIDIQARQISDNNGCNPEFHLFCSGETSLHPERLFYPAFITTLTEWLVVRVGISC